jgi:hypothetical protein
VPTALQAGKQNEFAQIRGYDLGEFGKLKEYGSSI